MAALALVVAGCKSSSEGSQIPPTPSGQPEIVVRGKTDDEIKAVAREFFVGRGYTERDSRHAYEMVFDKPAKAGKSDQGLRVDLRFQKQPDNSWRLIGAPMKVEDWHSDLESVIGVPQGKSQIQAFLNEIKARLE